MTMGEGYSLLKPEGTPGVDTLRLAHQCMLGRILEGGFCRVIGGCPAPHACHKPHERIDPAPSGVRPKDEITREWLVGLPAEELAEVLMRSGVITYDDQGYLAWLISALRKASSEPHGSD
jgi:hypothetical protein